MTYASRVAKIYLYPPHASSMVQTQIRDLIFDKNPAEAVSRNVPSGGACLFPCVDHLQFYFLFSFNINRFFFSIKITNKMFFFSSTIQISCIFDTHHCILIMIMAIESVRKTFTFLNVLFFFSGIWNRSNFWKARQLLLECPRRALFISSTMRVIFIHEWNSWLFGLNTWTQVQLHLK